MWNHHPVAGLSGRSQPSLPRADRRAAQRLNRCGSCWWTTPLSPVASSWRRSLHQHPGRGLHQRTRRPRLMRHRVIRARGSTSWWRYRDAGTGWFLQAGLRGAGDAKLAGALHHPAHLLSSEIGVEQAHQVPAHEALTSLFEANELSPGHAARRRAPRSSVGLMSRRPAAIPFPSCSSESLHVDRKPLSRPWGGPATPSANHLPQVAAPLACPLHPGALRTSGRRFR